MEGRALSFLNTLPRDDTVEKRWVNFSCIVTFTVYHFIYLYCSTFLTYMIKGTAESPLKIPVTVLYLLISPYANF